MPIIHVEMVAGRPPEARQALAAALTEATVAALGVKPEAVRVVLHEVAPEHWFVAGRPMARPAKDTEPQPAGDAEPRG
jgi:4-oxalocrotonate tautomerase